jgi:site-specific DNA recombinase
MSAVTIRAAFYARVSSDQQAKQATIASQVAALGERITADGLVLLPEHAFVDDGFSGSTLLRPQLERLRDAAYAGAFDRLYVHSPDRLARNYAHQFVLMEELTKAGVEVIFLNHPIGDSAEERLLLQMQGMIAEYERAKILERSRRGKRHAAQQGHVSALGRAPYGYRYLTKKLHGAARYEINETEAEVVRRIFHWVGQERVPLREVRRRLHQEGIPSPKNQEQWAPSTLTMLLRHSAYQGTALFRAGKTSANSGMVHQADATAEAIAIAVPPLVSAELFAAAQEQIQVNRLRSRQQRRGAHLLQGLAVCQVCGRAYTASQLRRAGRSRVYRYYRCTSMLCGPAKQRTCVNPTIPAGALEEAVWQDVSALLRDPQRLAAEYQRRLQQPQPAEALTWLEQQQTKDKRALTLLIDAYENGLLEKEEFSARISRARQRLQDWQTQIEAARQSHAQQAMLQQALGTLEQFARRLDTGLHQPTTTQQRAIVHALVKRVEVAPEKIRVIYRLHPLPDPASLKMGNLQHCSVRAHAVNRNP